MAKFTFRLRSLIIERNWLFCWLLNSMIRKPRLVFGGEVMRDMSAPSSESEGPDNQLELRTKVWFGVGTIGEAATNWIFNALTFIYYQQILGLGAALAALAVSIAIFADAITDPLIGSISDRFDRALADGIRLCSPRLYP